ncbi:hypothetical protein BH20ACT23_BH20ACT23_22890 [soil metagenome]
MSDAYTELGRMGVEVGATALPYEADPYGDKARVVWAGVLSLWGPSSALASCPVATTDGAARTLVLQRCCELAGRQEHGIGSEDEPAVLRCLTPVTKLATGRWSIAGVTEAMEAIGGVGYCEDSTIPALVRNTHVIPIWEGTTNVLSLDVLRSAQRSNALEALLDDARRLVADLVDDPRSGEIARAVLTALDELAKRSVEMADDAEGAEAGARSLALGTGSTYACALLCRQGHWAARRGHESTATVSARLAARGLVPALPPLDLSLAMDDE